MRNGSKHVITMAAIGAVAVLVTDPAAAKSAKDCNAEYVLRKDVVDAAKERKSDFMAECRARGAGEPTPIAASLPPAQGD